MAIIFLYSRLQSILKLIPVIKCARIMLSFLFLHCLQFGRNVFSSFSNTNSLLLGVKIAQHDSCLFRCCPHLEILRFRKFLVIAHRFL